MLWDFWGAGLRLTKTQRSSIIIGNFLILMRMRKEHIMVFGFSAENYTEKMKIVGMWGGAVKCRMKNLDAKDRPNMTPKFRKDCMMGEWMLLNQAKKVVESGFIKTRLNYEELMKDFYLSREQVMEVLDNYYRLVKGGQGDDGVFRSIDEFFACLVTGENVVDYHWNVTDRVTGVVGQNYTMTLAGATQLERKECYYFCYVMTKLAAGDFALSNGFLRVKSGFAGERYVQTVYDLSWFLAAKIMGMICETITPTRFFSETEDWGKYNRDPMAPAYITKVMETRKRMLGGVTTNKDIEDLFEQGYIEGTLLDGMIQKEAYIDIKLLEWATRIRDNYSGYAKVIGGD